MREVIALERWASSCLILARPKVLTFTAKLMLFATEGGKTSYCFFEFTR